MTVNKKNIENYGQQFISKKKDSGDFPTSKRDETKPFLQNSRNCLPHGFKALTFAIWVKTEGMAQLKTAQKAFFEEKKDSGDSPRMKGGGSKPV